MSLRCQFFERRLLGFILDECLRRLLDGLLACRSRPKVSPERDISLPCARAFPRSRYGRQAFVRPAIASHFRQRHFL